MTDIYRAFHHKEEKYTFFSNAHGTFSKIEHMIGHKTSLNPFKKIEIISSISWTTRDGNYKQISRKKPKTLKNMEIE